MAYYILCIHVNEDNWTSISLFILLHFFVFFYGIRLDVW
jgi:hypothetical protein